MKLGILPFLAMLTFIATLVSHIACSPTIFTTLSPTQYNLTTSVIPTEGGTVAPADGTYDAGTTVTLHAEPAPGYIFDEWSGDLTDISDNTSAPAHSTLIVVTMNVDREINARFKRQYSLNTSVNPADSGIVKHAGGSFDEDSNVTITAEPSPGYVFDYWSGDISGDMNPASIVATDNVNIVANFKPVFAIATAELPAAHAGIPYKYELKAINGSPPYYWSWDMPTIIQGKDDALATFYDKAAQVWYLLGSITYRWSGISLKPNGIISGTLTVVFMPMTPYWADDYTFTRDVEIKVRDSKNNKASKTLQMTLYWEK